jgi:hypothetical protein
MDGPTDFPRLTKRVMLMGLIYAMGGFVYGYDTGDYIIFSFTFFGIRSYIYVHQVRFPASSRWRVSSGHLASLIPQQGRTSSPPRGQA